MCAQKLFKMKKSKQKSYNAHFEEVNPNDEDDWKVRLIDQTVEKDNLFGNMSWMHFSQMD